MSAIALDTNAYTGLIHGLPAVIGAVRTAREIHLPLIVLGELLAGFAAGARAEANRRDLAGFLTSPRVAVLNPDQGTARHYAEIYAALRAVGSPIPTNDMWIAALARQHRLALLTFDSHFAAVPGLTVYTP